jgi:glutaredoxin-related protein
MTCRPGNLCPACDEAVRYLKGIPYAHRDRAADLGTSLHEAIEAHTLGRPYPPWPITIQTRMGHFVQFLEDWQPIFDQAEATVYNRSEKYAGTLDAIIDLDGRKILLDVKSGKGVYPEVALQLAAYRYAEFIGLPDGSEAGMPQVDECAVLHLTDEGYQLVPVVADERVFKAFLYAREVFRWQNETSKTVIGQPMERTLV